jgi:hypothetical protein
VKKIKNWWKTLKYWQRGFIIGFLSSIISISFFINAEFYYGFMEIFSTVIMFPLCFIEILFIPEGTGHPPLCVLSILLTPFIYGLIGALIGILIDKIKKYKSK